MKKVIVTGANGFLGSELVKYLNSENIAVIAIVRSDNIHTKNISILKNVKIVYCELSQFNKLHEIIKDRDVDCCIHLAWSGSTGDDRGNHKIQLDNVSYSVELIKSLKKMNVKRFVGAGSLAEKDTLNYVPSDGATPNQVSFYGVAKATTHFMTKIECTNMGIEHVWCYISNTYGVGNNTGNFINFACKVMLDGKRAAFTAGEQTYDFVYVTDTVRALFCAAGNGKSNCSYYLGSTKERKLKEFIKIIRNTIDENIQLYLGEIPFNGIALNSEEFSAKKLINDTGYEPTISFEEGIEKTVNWLRTNYTGEKV